MKENGLTIKHMDKGNLSISKQLYTLVIGNLISKQVKVKKHIKIVQYIKETFCKD